MQETELVKEAEQKRKRKINWRKLGIIMLVLCTVMWVVISYLKNVPIYCLIILFLTFGIPFVISGLGCINQFGWSWGITVSVTSAVWLLFLKSEWNTSTINLFIVMGSIVVGTITFTQFVAFALIKKMKELIDETNICNRYMRFTNVIYIQCFLSLSVYGFIWISIKKEVGVYNLKLAFIPFYLLIAIYAVLHLLMIACKRRIKELKIMNEENEE